MGFLKHIIAYFNATSIVYFKVEPTAGDTITVGKMVAEFKPFPKYRIDAELLEQRPFMLDVLTEQMASRMVELQAAKLDYEMQVFLAEQGILHSRDPHKIKAELDRLNLVFTVEQGPVNFMQTMYTFKLEHKREVAHRHIILETK